MAKLVKQEEEKAQEELKELEEQRQRWERERVEQRRVEARAKSRQELLAIVEAWSRACDLERFFEDLARRAAELEGSEKDALFARIEAARDLFGGTDVVT